MSKNLFITGTGTDIGKTYVTGLIVKKLKESGRSAGYFKAAMSGNDRAADGTLIPGDAMFVKAMAGIDQPIASMCPYVYETAVSPHLAAQLEGNPVRFETVKRAFEAAAQKVEYLTIEGSGGILCPLSVEEPLQLEDVIRRMGFSCVIVADAGLGTINHVGLTAFYMREKKIPVKGIIFNRFHPGDRLQEDNLKMCENLTGLKVLACVAENDTDLKIDAQALAALYED
ncbi:dethiobiotin synthase [Acidaminobacterium chupaoyuni]